MPRDYKRVLEARAEALDEGLTEDEANARIMEVLMAEQALSLEIRELYGRLRRADGGGATWLTPRAF